MRTILTRLAVALLATTAVGAPATAQGTAPAAPQSAAPLRQDTPPDSVVDALRAFGLTADGLRLNGRFSRGTDTVAAGDTLRGPFVVLGGNAEVHGVVAGDVHSFWGDVVIHRGAEVAGRASAYRGRVILDGGIVRGSMESWQPARAPAPAAAVPPMSRGRALALSAAWTAMLVVIGIAVLVLLASNLESTARVLEQDFGRAFFVGVMGQLGFLPLLLLACVVLAITIVGVLLIPFALVAGPIALAGFLTLGWLALALVTGRALAGARRDGASRGETLRALVFGVVLLMLPWVLAAALQGTGLGALLGRLVALAVTWVAASAGLGAALLSRAGAGERRPAERPQAPLQGWQTPTPVAGVAAARRPIPARPGATPQ